MLSAYAAGAQMCGQWRVNIEIVDSNKRPVANAAVSFVDVPAEDAASKHPFMVSDDAHNIFTATFIEGDRVSKDYKILIKASGFADLVTTTRISYCHETTNTKVLERRKKNSRTGS